ncbi:MAG: hypothetical protein ABSH22_03795 [Tepidisphaeraceae bacterium]
MATLHRPNGAKGGESAGRRVSFADCQRRGGSCAYHAPLSDPVDRAGCVCGTISGAVAMSFR